MSLTVNLTNAFTRVATENKALRTLINGNSADLSSLSTTAKTTLVAAINELDAEIAAVADGAAGINDAVVGLDTTWSSQKTSDEIAQAKNDILGGAGGAYDTLQELKDLLDASDAADDSALAAITTALTKRVRVDAVQAFTEPERQQGRDNLDVYSRAEIGDVNTNFVTVFEAGLV